jgi:hypothetical protein
MSDVLWEIEVELVSEDLQSGRIEREDAIRRYMRLGFDRDEAESHAASGEQP